MSFESMVGKGDTMGLRLRIQPAWFDAAMAL
jgi:hypothetical protein